MDLLESEIALCVLPGTRIALASLPRPRMYTMGGATMVSELRKRREAASAPPQRLAEESILSVGTAYAA